MALSLEQYPCILDYKNGAIKILGVSINNGDQIPEHLLIEILSRLPIKALLQFKSVCKLWYDIIKSSYFISKHLRNYYDDNNNWRDCLIVQYETFYLGGVNVYELLIDDTKNRALSHQSIKIPVDNSYLCGPCNGIYFLWRYNSIAPKHSLWNPALNEFKILPDITKGTLLPCSAYNLNDEYYGFGYDSKTDDYKVILIWDYYHTRDDNSINTNDQHKSILIYSLRSNSWRYWGDMDTTNLYNLDSNSSYAFVNGCYYWLASRELDFHMIVSFDISGEAYQEIPLPKFESRPIHASQLIVYQDSIAFVLLPEDNTSFSIWTWNEVVWTQKFSLKLDSEVWGAFSSWRDNMIVFREDYRKLVLCDTNTKEIFFLDDSQGLRLRRCRNICAYKESLVSIKDFGKDTVYNKKHKARKNRLINFQDTIIR